MSKISFCGKIYEWDEESVAETHNVRNRKTCFNHSWINASLHLETPFKGDKSESSWWVSLECWGHEKPFVTPAWGSGYGGIRFCKNCKAIDCIHLWGTEEPKDESWKNCTHIWEEHGALTGWSCSKCGAQYNWMCGCGGSQFVCGKHYKEMLLNIKSEGGLSQFLKERAFAPTLPCVKTCKICEKKIRIF